MLFYFSNVVAQFIGQTEKPLLGHHKQLIKSKINPSNYYNRKRSAQ